jgi:hypothetical protein
VTVAEALLIHLFPLNLSPPSVPTPITTLSDPNTSTILAIRDSFFEWHMESQQSISDEIGKALQTSVDNRAISGASLFGVSDDEELLNVKDQYEVGNWDWVEMNGGSNDVNDKCQCNACEGVIDELISIDATTGELPSLVTQMLQNGNKVVFVMYPEIEVDAEYGFEQCEQEFIEVEYRVNQLALNTENFWIVSASDVVPTGKKKLLCRRFSPSLYQEY